VLRNAKNFYQQGKQEEALCSDWSGVGFAGPGKLSHI